MNTNIEIPAYEVIPAINNKLAMRLKNGPFNGAEFCIDDIFADDAYAENPALSFSISVLKVHDGFTGSCNELEKNTEFQGVISDLISGVLTKAIEEEIKQK